MERAYASPARFEARAPAGDCPSATQPAAKDIQLAAAIRGISAQALTPRGEAFSTETVGEHLAMRELMDELRTSGVDTGGPSVLGQTERQAFTRQLDIYLARRAARSRGPRQAFFSE